MSTGGALLLESYDISFGTGDKNKTDYENHRTRPSQAQGYGLSSASAKPSQDAAY